jgi:hypothetical protein
MKKHWLHSITIRIRSGAHSSDAKLSEAFVWRSLRLRKILLQDLRMVRKLPRVL